MFKREQGWKLRVWGQEKGCVRVQEAQEPLGLFKGTTKVLLNCLTLCSEMSPVKLFDSQNKSQNKQTNKIKESGSKYER